MTVANIRNKVIEAENNVTSALNAHGESSVQYKEALRRFASDWSSLKKHENFISCVLKD